MFTDSLLMEFLLLKYTFTTVALYLFVYFSSLIAILLLLAENHIKSNNIIKTIKLTIHDDNNYYYLLIFFSSLVGIPPLAGFITKSFLVFFIFIKFNLFYAIVFYLLIIFSVFFYLQVLKLVKKVELDCTDIVKTGKRKNNGKFFKSLLLVSLSVFLITFCFFFKDWFFIFYFFS